MRHLLLSGWWIDTGKLTPLLEANRLLLEKIDPRIDGKVDADSSVEGRVIVAGRRGMVNSTIRVPSRSAQARAIVDSFIGPFSAIGDGCEVVNSEIEHSVVMDHSNAADPAPRGQPDRPRGRHRADIEAAAGAAPDDRRPLPGGRGVSAVGMRDRRVHDA